jgi:signal transduction histidine kinase
MSLYGSPGLDRPGAPRRSIRFTFTTTVAAPVVCLILLWGLVVSAVLAGLLTDHGLSARYHRVLEELTGIVGASLVVVLVSALLMGLFARRISREVSALEATAKYLSDDQLTQLVRQLRQGERAALPGEGPLRPLMRIAEISRAAQAIASLQHTAVMATVGEARLRGGIGDVFVSLARRNQSLLQKQLRLIDELEQKAANPAALADLFPLDHLTTRMRRQAESLIILAGAAPGRSWSEPVLVVNVIRGAVAEIEDYQRVVVRAASEDAVAGSAAADMIHLLAELIENAAVFSPPRTQVEVRTERVVNGVVIEIDDRGLGIKPTQLGVINQQLAHPPDFDLANADQLGLFVVGKLAARHRARVTLKPSPYGGTTAVVLLPAGIVVPAPSNGQRRRAEGTSALPIRRRGTSALPAPPAPGGVPSAPPAPGGVPSAPPPPGWVPPPPGGVPPAPGRVPAEELPAAVPETPPAAPGTYRGLPRRVRQASLSPHLKNAAPSAGNAAAGPAGPAAMSGNTAHAGAAARAQAAPMPEPGTSPASAPPAQAGPAQGGPAQAGQAGPAQAGPAQGGPASARAPDSVRDPAEARALVAAMQNGWRRGRAADYPTTQRPAATPTAQPGNTAPEGQPGTGTPGPLPGPGPAAPHGTTVPSPAQQDSDGPGSEVEP